MFIDPNPVDYRDTVAPVGDVSLSGLEVTGKVDGNKAGIILIVDCARRFVLAERVAETKFSLKISEKAAKSSTWPLRVYSYDERANIAWPLGEISSAETEGAQPVPSHRAQYIGQITEAMKEKYTSISSRDGIKTGNGYQSVTLDSIATIGGRPHRDLFFRHVDFRGKSVLDIGCNTGELSRLARKRGAALVDGYEYDPFFVETGRMINAATGMTRVSLFQGDATNRELWAGKKYDIVLTFAVWVYTAHLLDAIAEMTDVVLFETHTLDHGLDMYTEPMSKHFPYYRILGFDELRDMRKSRCVLLFAKTEKQLSDALTLPTILNEPYFSNTFFQSHRTVPPSEFGRFAQHIYEKVSKEKPTFEALGLPYFENFLAGFHQYKTAGCVTDDNHYMVNYKRAIAGDALDPNLKYLLEDEFLLKQKMESKFRDVDNKVGGKSHLVPPPIVQPGDGPLKFTTVDGDEFRALNIDGHHRMFMNQLLGLKTSEVLFREPITAGRSRVNTQYAIR